MAESGGQQQRAFSKNIKHHSALQIRQSTIASVRAVAEKTRPKLRIVEPLDYEGELITRRKDLEKEPFLNLILFPQQDVTVRDEEWQHRTEMDPVPPGVIKEAPSLFTYECLKLYCSQWHRVDYSYSRFASSFNRLIRPDYLHTLPEETFELDLVDEEKYASISMNKNRGCTPLSKQGYLFKGNFSQDGASSVSMKNYRKRWFTLIGGPSEGGYTLAFYKDEKSSNIKGKICLDTCTEVKANTRYKAFRFDLLTRDDPVFYPLAASGDEEMEDWISILNRAISMEVEETDAGPATISSFYAKDTLKDTKRINIQPEMLEYTDGVDDLNAKRREADRHPLFHVYPSITLQDSSPSSALDECRPPAAVPQEKFGYQFLLRCQSLNFRLKMERNGNHDHIEPFFVSFAIYDVNKCLKISENFHVDFNSAFLRQMVPPPAGHTEDGPHPLCLRAARANEGIFSVMFPNQDVFLVAKVEKVLQGGILGCAEPYIKDVDNVKSSQKLSQQFTSVMPRLGQYRMPFAWAVRPLFNTLSEIDTEAEFSSLYRQEKDKLSDEDIIKILSSYRTMHKQKLQTIPGELKVDVLPLSQPINNCVLDPSYFPVKSTVEAGHTDHRLSRSSTSPISQNPTLELKEFPPLDAYYPHTYHQPHFSFTHHLYVYPSSLKYDNQKFFTKARNLACCVQFKDMDDPDSPALSVIYCKSPGAVFTDRAKTPVTHHCTCPSFYEEVKIKLPLKLQQNHHLLFTFFHISCDVQKKNRSRSPTRQLPTEIPVGYAWQPLLDSEGRLQDGTHSLSVSAVLPAGYLGVTPQYTTTNVNNLPRGGSASPEIRWVDNQKQLFKVVTKFDSTIYSQDFYLHHFFIECQRLHGKAGNPLPLGQLLSSIKVLDDMSLTSLMQFLPLVLTQLFRILSHPSKEVKIIKPDVFRILLSLVDEVVKAECSESLHSYIEYIFLSDVGTSGKRTVHDEVAYLLVQYFRQTTTDESHIPRLLDHLWFFLEIMVKSMAQNLTVTKTSRKTRYLESYGWDLQNMIPVLLTHIREKHTELSAKRANRSLANFVKRAFSFMDRGVVFKIVAKYLEAFSIREENQLSSLKLEFIKIMCEHEHFIPLNLPFPMAVESMEFGLSDEFCRRHFLVGILLREVESVLEYEVGPNRAKTLKILRNLLAKHDCDSRYSEVGQRNRIASLYFPLIPLVLNHVSRLDTGSNICITPMLNAASMATFKASSSDGGNPLNPSASVPNSAAGTLTKDKERDMERSLDKIASGVHHLGSEHVRKSSDMSLDQTELLSSVTESFNASLQWEDGVEEMVVEMDKFSVQETRDLLISTMFIIKHLDASILHYWWRDCMGYSNTTTLLFYEEVHTSHFSQLMDFFDLLESCIYCFKYPGRKMHRDLEQTLHQDTVSLASSRDKTGKKASLLMISSPTSSLQFTKSKAAARYVSSPTSTLPSSPAKRPAPSIPDTMKEEIILMQGALANEVGHIILALLDRFSAYFRKELCQDEGDNILMTKYFSVLVTFLQINQSLSFQTHVFALLRSFMHKYCEVLFRGSADYCGILCYEILQHCNSRLQSTRKEATVLFYLLMRYNFEYFKGNGFIRTNLQSTIAVSKLVSTLIGQSDCHIRHSLDTIATYVTQDVKVQSTSFPSEVKDLMVRLKTVLSSTAQMMIHQNDHEKLVDLHYTLAKSYGNSPELRQTWLDSMTALHLKYGNYSEAAQCCIHIAGLVAEYLKIKNLFPAGCSCFCHVSPNVALDESSIKEDQETGDEQMFSERNLVALLETSIKYLEKAERYEMMAEVLKILQPFYEKNRDFKHMMEMYSKLHDAFRKVVDIMTTGKRYLGTYFRVAFFGKPFGEDNDKEFIYKEPKVTTLAELTLALEKLYTKKFGCKDIVHIIQESGKVNTATLNLDHAYIQITYVVPYFSTKELEERKCKFERENNISRFTFETPFTQDGKTHGNVTRQCMRKTILTTSHWFPYVKKRIIIIHQEQCEISPIQVAIEAMSNKTRDLALVVKMDPPDLKRLQLLLGGSISTQVNQGAQEYIVFFKDCSKLPPEHVEELKQMYRMFLQVCQEALELNGRLISADQLLYHDDLKVKFQQMETALAPYLAIMDKGTDKLRTKTPPMHGDGLFRKRCSSKLDPYRMSAILFHSISSNK